MSPQHAAFWDRKKAELGKHSSLRGAGVKVTNDAMCSAVVQMWLTSDSGRGVGDDSPGDET